MFTKVYKMTTRVIYRQGNLRSLPAEVGSGCGPDGALSSHPRELPVPMSSGTGIQVLPVEPTNESSLALEHLPQSQPDPVEA